MKLKVFGKDVQVIEEAGLIDQGMYGFYHAIDKNIKIDKKLKGNKKNHTLLHELFHASLDRLGFNNTSLSTDMEELIVDNLAQVLLDNLEIRWKRHK